jgi:hypothetical protein
MQSSPVGPSRYVPSFAKSLKPSNRTVGALASNPAGLGHRSLEWFDFSELSIVRKVSQKP